MKYEIKRINLLFVPQSKWRAILHGFDRVQALVNNPPRIWEEDPILRTHVLNHVSGLINVFGGLTVLSVCYRAAPDTAAAWWRGHVLALWLNRPIDSTVPVELAEDGNALLFPDGVYTDDDSACAKVRCQAGCDSCPHHKMQE